MSQDDPVSSFYDDPRVPRSLQKVLRDEIERAKSIVLNAASWEIAIEARGEWKGLEKALSICTEIEKQYKGE